MIKYTSPAQLTLLPQPSSRVESPSALHSKTLASKPVTALTQRAEWVVREEGHDDRQIVLGRVTKYQLRGTHPINCRRPIITLPPNLERSSDESGGIDPVLASHRTGSIK